MFFDFHSHLDMYENPDVAVRQLAELGVYTISAATDVESYLKTVEISRTSDLIVPTFGIHPSRAHLYTGSLDSLDRYVDISPVIGEIGLDYLWAEPLDEAAQKKIFCYIAEKAVEQDKYMVIHTKNAEEDVLALLDEMNAEKVIVHWYSGPMDIYRQYIERGWYFTFGIELMHSPYIRELAVAAPIDRLLPETDNPVGVEWLAGRTGMPEDIIPVYDALSETVGYSIESQLKENALRVLGKLNV